MEANRTKKDVGGLARKVFWNIRLLSHVFHLHSRIGKNLFLSIQSGGHISVGDYFVCRSNCTIVSFGDLIFGEKVFLNSNVSITCLGEITIGDGSTIGNNVVIVDHDHDYLSKNGGFFIEPVVIGKNVWIGANSVILRGVHIGDFAVVAAGSVVKNDVPSRTLFYDKRNENIKAFPK